MTKRKIVYEEITLIFSDGEREKAGEMLDKGHWRIRYAGPVFKDFKAEPGKFKIVAVRKK